jgi:hypothetical protein
MNILFFIRTIYQFSYVKSIVNALDDGANQITLLFDPKWSAKYSRNVVEDFLLHSKNARMKWALQRRGVLRYFIFNLRELRSYAGYLRRPEQSTYYQIRWKRYLPMPVGYIAGTRSLRHLLSRDSVFELFSRIENFVSPDSKILESLLDLQPDIVVVTPMIHRFSEEVEYIKAAKAAQIPTAALALTWDVLTTKGLFHVIPDLTMVWNGVQRSEAVQVHGVKDEQILEIGSPWFDKWFNADALKEDRRQFCSRIGLHPGKSYVLYLGSSRSIAKDETWLIREFMDKIKQHADPDIRNLAMLVRPHPAHTKYYNQMGNSDIFIWPREGALPQEEATQRDFYNSIYHSAFTAGINTSGMIDAIILGKPCITIMAGEYSATQQQAVHFNHLLDADVLHVTQSTDEALAAVQQLSDGVDHHRAQRQRFVANFVRPWGLHISAGETAAMTIELLAQGKSVQDIKAEITAYASSKERSGAEGPA